MKAKNKKVLLAMLSVALVAAISAAGTVAYLQSTSEDVVNTFSSNSVQVKLEENSGQEYDIVPGTTDTKDPKVKATVTLPSYVFVEVTDVVNGQGKKLVEYTVDENTWTKLSGYDNIWYREISESDNEFVSVLKGDTITYPASLTNEDLELLTEENNTLSFKASAIQKEPFKDAAEAWLEVPVTVTDAAELQKALDNAVEGKSIVLGADVTVTKSLRVTKNTILDLNDKTISNENDIWNVSIGDWSLLSVSEGGELTINGDGEFLAKENDCYALDVQSGGKLTINGGTYNGNISAVYVSDGELTVNGGTFMIQQLEKGTGIDRYRFMLNCLDDNYKNETAKITVTGGTFQNYNPADNKAEGDHTNFVAGGYVVQSEEKNDITWYTVSKSPQEAADETAQAVINEAVDGNQ